MSKKPVKASAKTKAKPTVKTPAKSAKQMENDRPRSIAPYPEDAQSRHEPAKSGQDQQYGHDGNPVNDGKNKQVNPANQLDPGVTIDPPSAESGGKQVVYVTAEGKHVPCCASHVKATPPEQRTDRARLVARNDSKVLIKDWVPYSADKTPNTWHYPDSK